MNLLDHLWPKRLNGPTLRYFPSFFDLPLEFNQRRPIPRKLRAKKRRLRLISKASRNRNRKLAA